MEGGRSLKVEQLFVGFTCNNFCPSGAQVEKELKMAGEKKKCNLGSSPPMIRLLGSSWC